MTLEELGGYRIVRKLGEGARCDVHLAHDDRPDSPAVAIKAYREGVPDTVPLAEAEALHRAAGPHVVRLIDVAPDAAGVPMLVLERLRTGGLARVLRDRASLSTGEAITILAPIAFALARVHDAGVLHGGLGADPVLFDSSGAPVLAGFGRARLVGAGLSAAARDAEPGFAADLEAFGSVAAEVLMRVRDARASALLERPGSLRDFGEALFDLGEAEPVRFEAEPAAVPARVVRGEPVPVEPEGHQRGLPDWIERMLPAGVADGVRDAVTRLRAALSAVRRPVWIAAAAVATALLAAIVLVPSGTDAQPRPTPEATHPPTPTPAGPVAGDDPVAAAMALLDERERCIRDLSVLCLDGVAQAGSSALLADQALVRELQQGAESPAEVVVDRDAVALVERLGDSAIVSLGANSEPASLLLMQGEAGWRIREYLSQ